MRSYTKDDIVHHTGIPENKVTEICNLLSLEGYLILDQDTGKYRLTNDRDLLDSVKKMWSQYRDESSFEQMVGKIEDINKFGKPLALTEKGPGEAVEDIGVPGLNIIFGNWEDSAGTGADRYAADAKRTPGLPRGHCILLKGAPGTGKTTLGMQIALYLKKYRARFLTFEEDVNQLTNDLHGYIQKESGDEFAMGWKKGDIKEVTRFLIKIRTPHAWEKHDIVMEELVSILDRELPHFIVIDSISRFRDLGGDNNARKILRSLIRNLKCRRITAFFIGEDRGDENAFEEYEVDGILYLNWAGDLLNLTVKKLRGMKAYKGPHSAALITLEDLEQPQHNLISEKKIKERGASGPYLTVGFNIFPDISVIKDIPGIFSTIGRHSVRAADWMSTGTPGLDELLPLPDEKKGFKRGETVLLVGSAGAGKTLLALNFMLDGYRRTDPGDKTIENTLWINLEGAIGTLRFATRGFQDPYKSEIEDMLKMKQNKKTGSRFTFIDFPPINLDLNKIVYTLEAIHRNYGIDRLVIDSITELERAKGSGQPAVKVFLAGLIQFLRHRKITSVFVCRSDAFFGSIDKIEEQVSSLVDLIICIRNFDIHNQIHKGVYIQKARGRRHNSRIMRMLIDPKRVIVIEDSGWDLENMLAGDTSSITSPAIFFKLFYENPAEEYVNEKIIEDFDKKRYPGHDPKFTLVKKPSIYTEFWSFRGQYSAGHANTRVLSIPDYVITAFRDNDRLAELSKYIKDEVLQKGYSEPHLRRRYQNQNKEIKDYLALDPNELIGKNIDAIPCYRDYGVMVLNEAVREFKKPSEGEYKHEEEAFLNMLREYAGKVKELDDPSGDDKAWIYYKKREHYEWERILVHIHNVNQSYDYKKEERGFFPFALPSLDNKSEFVSFFMELLWSYGGDLYRSSAFIKTDREQSSFKERIKQSVFEEFIECCGSNKNVLSKVLMKEKVPVDKNEKSLLEKFENMFLNYKIDVKNISIKEFKKWLAKNLGGMKEPGQIESVLNLSDDYQPLRKAIQLMLRLVYMAGVINPIEGDFRHRAILSRNWYSRIFLLKMEKCNRCVKPTILCKDFSHRDKEKCCRNYLRKKDKKYKLLPLPPVKIEIELNERNKKSIYRSVTCFTYWSLVMLKNALSPEIGGNFIESMNAPNYYEERIKSRFGMPVTYTDIKKEKFRECDPESYSILGRTVINGIKNVETLKEYRKVIKEEKIRKPEEILEKGSRTYYQERLKSTDDHTSIRNHTFVCSDFKEMPKELRSAFFFFRNDEKLNRRIFFPKVRQSRTAFYQLEEALHFQLKRLFNEYPGNSERAIYDGKNIVEKIKIVCEEERRKYFESKDSCEGQWDPILKSIIKEFRTHVIFELLTYFYHEHVKKTDEEGKESDVRPE